LLALILTLHCNDITNQITMRRNWIRGIIGGLSFTSALFIFQACYGMPQDMMPDVLVSGKVTSKTTGLPIKGIKVSLDGQDQYVSTTSMGEFSLYTLLMEQMVLRFEDVDAMANGTYASRDTLLTDVGHEVYVEMALDEE
jgi:hypothetical protein